MKVCDYIAKFLVLKGVEDVFFVDGSAAAAMQVAVSENKDLTYWVPHHEQGGAMAVDGYFKASRKIAAMIATSGPGGQNLVTGIACSWYDSIPGFYLTGNINSKFMKPSDEVRQHGFQEGDIVSMVKGITKFAHQVTRPEDIRYYLEKAWYEMRDGRYGPVLLDIPMDIQKAEIDEDTLTGYITKPKWSEFGYGSMESIALLVSGKINKAKRPFILVGGGVFLSHCECDVREFIRCTGIPYAVTWNMLDFGTYGDPNYAGRVGTFGGDGRNFAIQNCDLLICIGSRVSGRITGGMTETFARDAVKIIVDIDQDELRWQQVKGDFNLSCPINCFCESRFLLGWDAINSDGKFHTWRDKCIEWRDTYRVYDPEKHSGSEGAPINPYKFIHELSQVLPDDAVVVHEAGGNCVVTSQGIECKKGQRVFTNNGNSSLGYALPAAIGAAIATKGARPIYCICGDGGFQFNMQELAMIKAYNLPIKILIFNNKAYGITKAYRDTNFNSNYAGVDAEHGQVNPDFEFIARAYGLMYKKLFRSDKLHKNLEIIENTHWFKNRKNCIVEVNMEGFYDYHPKLGWRQPIEDQYPFLPRDEFISNMIIEPHSSWKDPQYP